MTVIERVKKVVKWLIFIGYAENERDIAEKLGYTKSSFSQIVTEKVPVSDKFLRKLSSAHENINEVWIMDGEGEMLKGNELPTLSSNKLIPLLPISAQGGSLNDFVISVSEANCEKIISPIKDAEYAMSVAGDSMTPEYPSGSQILIKKINERAFIDWGKVYVLDTCNGSLIKKLMPPEDKASNSVRCVSINSEYPPFEVDLSDVYGVYRVLLCMSIK